MVYHRWSWYWRAADPTARIEAVASRPLLLAAVGKAARHAGHAGQTTLYLTPIHGKTKHLKSLLANIRKALQHVRVAAEQFKAIDPWPAPLRYVSDRIALAIGPFRPPAGLAVSG